MNVTYARFEYIAQMHREPKVGNLSYKLQTISLK